MLTYSGMLVKLLSYLATIYHPEWVGCSKFAIFFCTILRLFYHHILQQYVSARALSAEKPCRKKWRILNTLPNGVRMAREIS